MSRIRVVFRAESGIEKVTLEGLPGDEEKRDWRLNQKRWVIEEWRGHRWVQIGGSSVA